MNMRYLILTLYLTLICFSAHAETRSLVLVSNSEANISEMSHKDLKKVYLGLATDNNNQIILPIRNHTDELVHEIFLQNILRMSSRTYERLLNKRTLHSGAVRPKSFNNSQEIIRSLLENESSVSYMWKSQAELIPELKIIQVIWTGDTD